MRNRNIAEYQKPCNWYLDIDFNLPPQHCVGQFLLFFHLQTPPVLSFALVGANVSVAILPVLVPYM